MPHQLWCDDLEEARRLGNPRFAARSSQLVATAVQIRNGLNAACKDSIPLSLWLCHSFNLQTDDIYVYRFITLPEV